MVEVKFSLHAIEAYWGVKVWLHSFLTLALDGRQWSAIRSSRFTPREQLCYSFNSRLGGTHSWSRYFAKREKYPALARIQNLNPPAHSQITIPTTLSLFFCQSENPNFASTHKNKQMFSKILIFILFLTANKTQELEMNGRKHQFPEF